MLSTVKKPKGPTLPADIEKLFDDHSSFVLRVAYRITGNKTEAEDIVQAVFLRLLQSGRTLHIEGNPKGYLYRAAVNMGLDFIRHQSRNISSDMMDEYEITTPNPDREYRSAEIQAGFRRALSKLSERSAEIFVLKHLEGYENHEIAKMLGTTRATVAVTLVRSRVFLRKSMQRFLAVQKGAIR